MFRTPLTLLTLLLSGSLFAQDYDDEEFTGSDVVSGLLVGAVLAGIGALLYLFPSTRKTGKGFVMAGAGWAVLGVVLYVLYLVLQVVSTVVSFGLMLFAVLVVLGIVFAILKGIYDWFRKNA